MFLKIISRIPYLQCLYFFPYEAHVIALKKFGVLWVLTSLPVIFAAFLSPVDLIDGEVLPALWSKITEAISVSELFVYIASFLTPVLYILYERYVNTAQAGFNKRVSQSFKELFNGYGVVAFTALLLMLITVAAFSALKTNPDVFKSTYLSLFLTKYSWLIYVFALYCWYLSLLDGVHTGDFVVANRKSEKAVSRGLADRVRSREDAI